VSAVIRVLAALVAVLFYVWVAGVRNAQEVRARKAARRTLRS
jgi:hypothetical protein